MTRKKYYVTLTREKRETLIKMLEKGDLDVKDEKRVKILLKSDEGWGDPEIADEVGISIPTVRRVRYNFVKRGLMGAIYHKQQKREHVRKIQGKWKAQLIQLINSKPPEGYARWNLRVLTEAYNQLEGEGFKKVSHETMRQTLIRFGIRLEEE